MRLFFFAVLLIALSAHIVSQEREANARQSTYQGQPATERQYPQPVISNAKSDQQSRNDQHSRGDREDKSYLPSPEWVTAVSTFLILVATSAYAITSYQTLKKIGVQADIADAQRVEMIRHEEYARQQWRAMHEQGITLKEQLAELERQTNVTRITSEATRASVRLQEAAFEQWVNLQGWSSELQADEESLWTFFRIVNMSRFPLILDIVLVGINDSAMQDTGMGIGEAIPPDQPHATVFETRLTPEQLSRYKAGRLALKIDCSIAFRTILGKQREQLFQKVMMCGPTETSVRDFRSQLRDSTPKN